MLLPEGEYRYEIRRGAELIAIEEESRFAQRIRGTRHPATSSDSLEVEADLDEANLITRLVMRYKRGPFVRDATYEADGDFLRGNVSAMAGRNVLTTKLGRYREVDADLVIFRALTIAHIRARGQSQWTGRVAIIDPNTLVGATYKQSCRQMAGNPLAWIYEQRMGDREEIEIDETGVIIRRRDNRGFETVLISRRDSATSG
ncbi:MAG: hypothetical protein Q7S58_03060 [Candidatus Binatus sp.]|uniref:hypothetical protein n=1 Tax=Candidatus Binatus sp. TaxID=2811406 RepID=UPI00271F2403|nr:hypothetical protein [Candidatus Binatus sp.]MDO8431368.1 hypothetical protein [Candidatus Binatus sp.]